MAICQVDDIIIGSGALSNSIFYNAYLEGQIDEQEIIFDFFAAYPQMSASVTANLQEAGENLIIQGKYEIAGYDHGAFIIKKTT